MTVRTRSALASRLKVALAEDKFWGPYLDVFARGDQPERSLHVAIFREPFLTWVIEGRKPVESRFSQNEVAPYGVVRTGDAVVLKQVAGPVLGICHVRSTSNYRLDPRTWKFIRDRFSELLCATEDEFWAARQAARFATLIFLEEVRALPPIEYAKSDRRGWVVECGPIHQQSLDL